MSSINITVIQDDKKHVLATTCGEPVSNVLRNHGLQHQPCGGAGVCGKCLIYAKTEPTPDEKKRLPKHLLESGVRLACYTLACEGLTLRIPEQDSARVLTTFSTGEYDYQPLVQTLPFTVSQATLNDQKTDLNNILNSCGIKDYSLSLKQLAKLPAYMRSREYGTALIHKSQLVGFKQNSDNLLLSVDIGTTTVAATLFDLNARTVLKSIGEQNAQSPFGADVVSRIQHSIVEGEKGVQQLQDAIVNQINRLKDVLIAQIEGDYAAKDVSMIAITGNTTMVHFFCGIPAEHISKAPFISVTLDPLQLKSEELGIESHAPLFIMPGISAYVGADIVAALLAAGVHKEKDPFLLIDFGTNAEIVLSAGDKIYACSTAAGPCFEGATLSCGSVAKAGAIDTIFSVDDGFSFTTIDNAKATGLCGSAVIDAIALLLESGDLDETGRLEGGGKLTDFIIEQNDELIFALTDNVYLSQSDIRKIQLAKAAVRAGAETLIEESGLPLESFSKLFLAGGFGSALNPASAERIGLVPHQMGSATRVLGNGAGYGVIRYATEKNSFDIVTDIKRRTEYIELSAHLKFNEQYVEQMMFPAVEYIE